MTTEEINIPETIECCPDLQPENIPDFELKLALDKAVLKEVKEADNVVTKHTIHLRVYKKIAKLLGLDMDMGIDPKSINIHPTNIARIDEKWKKHIQKNYQVSHDEMNAYDKIKSTDYVKYPDIIKFISVLVRKDIVDRDPNDKEKIIKSKDLGVLLGVDGFLGYAPSDMKNYIDNLKYGQNIHVETVRKMYDLNIVKSLSGTDASCLIFLALVSIYKNSVSDDQAILAIDGVESDIKTYLSKNAKYYKDITTALNQLNELVDFYKENVNEEEISKICALKVADLIAKSKKRKATAVPGKRGRKKLKIETEQGTAIQVERTVKLIEDDVKKSDSDSDSD